MGHCNSRTAANNPTSSALTITDAADATLLGERFTLANESLTACKINSFGVSRRQPIPTVIVGGLSTKVRGPKGNNKSVMTTRAAFSPPVSQVALPVTVCGLKRMSSIPCAWLPLHTHVKRTRYRQYNTVPFHPLREPN